MERGTRSESAGSRIVGDFDFIPHVALEIAI
jgi:hypothetical protein